MPPARSNLYFDLWTSPNNKAIIATTVHFIDHKGDRQVHLIALLKLSRGGREALSRRRRLERSGGGLPVNSYYNAKIDPFRVYATTYPLDVGKAADPLISLHYNHVTLSTRRNVMYCYAIFYGNTTKLNNIINVTMSSYDSDACGGSDTSTGSARNCIEVLPADLAVACTQNCLPERCDNSPVRPDEAPDPGPPGTFIPFEVPARSPEISGLPESPIDLILRFVPYCLVEQWVTWTNNYNKTIHGPFKPYSRVPA
ncbi:hypothetical protein CSAL01_12462 [Colletotrichum salicis]|uniref:Uncharacterized protein n=1 Tax=Colletotrichum salicis TaxID=1209931 RepID=A0A135V0D9_9PEZI|nr:hypothetical protein CSAL01_12462 [Colletotrichum salicis]